MGIKRIENLKNRVTKLAAEKGRRLPDITSFTGTQLIELHGQLEKGTYVHSPLPQQLRVTRLVPPKKRIAEMLGRHDMCGLALVLLR